MVKVYNQNNLSEKDFTFISQKLKAGGVAVMPSDTIYGIFTSALNPTSVEKIYELRKRDKDKALIIVISSLDQLDLFKINLSNDLKKFLEKNWPNPLSVILDCPSEDLGYLHRGLNTIAIRMPKNDFLQKIIELSGPLVAPSANFAGEIPAENIKKAQNYFKDQVDFYIDGGELKGEPSTIIKIEGNKIEILRQGAYKIS